MDRTNKLIDHGLKTFFPDDIAYELSCEKGDTCTTDMISFKGYLHRWYTLTTVIAPFTAVKILPVLKKSAQAAIAQCTGAPNGRACGFKWSSGAFDKTGAGQQMNVVAATSALLAPASGKAPVTAKTGGTSKGNANAGEGGDDFQKHHRPITTGDKAGAGILTFLVLAGAAGMFGWMSIGS